MAGSVTAGIEKTSTRVDVGAVLKRQTAIFHWEDVCYDIKIKKQPRRILDHVDGWVKPGTLTALMVSTRPQAFEAFCLTHFRVFPAPVKPLFSMCSLLVQPSG